MLCFLNCLPPEILRFIANYLLKDQEDVNKKVFRFSRDWRNFMNTRKSFFSKWKKESQLITLSYPLVETYYHSPEVREKVLQYIEDPRTQLDLNFNYNYEDGERNVNLKDIEGTRRICISRATVVPCPLFHVDELELVDCTLTDTSFSFYSKIKVFIFQDDASDVSFDLGPLENLECGEFSFRQCINHDCLSHLLSLEIGYCDSITDVTCFRNIPKLTLTQCCNITDVSSLGNVRELDLSCNDGITDVSALGNVHTLSVNSCENLIDVSALTNVHTLDLGCCPLIADVSGLKSVVVLDLSECFRITDISMLSALEELTLRNCEGIHTLAGLHHLKKLEVDEMSQLRSDSIPITNKLSQLQIHENLIIVTDESEYSQGFNYFPKISTLKFYDCPLLPDLPSFPNLRSLTVGGCKNFSFLPFLPALGYLEIYFCAELESFDILGAPDLKYPLYELNIHNCLRLRKVSFRRKVFQCRINWCEELKTMEVFEQIDSLKFYGCTGLQKISNQSLIVSIHDLSLDRRINFSQTDIEFE
jgi:hypothetical protein